MEYFMFLDLAGLLKALDRYRFKKNAYFFLGNSFRIFGII